MDYAALMVLDPIKYTTVEPQPGLALHLLTLPPILLVMHRALLPLASLARLLPPLALTQGPRLPRLHLHVTGSAGYYPGFVFPMSQQSQSKVKAQGK